MKITEHKFSFIRVHTISTPTRTIVIKLTIMEKIWY